MTRLKPGTIWPTPEEDAAINAAIAADPDTWEVTGELIPMTEADPELVEWYLAEQERIAACAKTRVTIRLDADVVARLREDGAGWQTRANDALRRAVLGA